ncbi:MAG: B12-binding domain-containing radical SAM protein [Myxococcaceae bacterium]
MAVLLGHLKARGLEAQAIDANLEGYLHLLEPGRLHAAAGAHPATSLKRAIRHAGDSLALLRSPGARGSFARYSTAVRHLNTALSAYPAEGGELTLGDFVHPGLSEFSPADLERLTRGEARTVFAGYFREVLLPRIERARPRLVALSVNFRNQVLPAFELAGMLRRALPGVPIVGGGGMFSSWRAPLKELGLRFTAFGRVVLGPGEAPLFALASGAAGPDYLLEDASQVSLAPDYDFAPLGDYLSPERVLPVSATRGCYWRRCLFCPESAAPTHPYRCGPPKVFPTLLRELSQRHRVRHFHLTDAAVPVNVLRQLAAHPAEMDGLAWHGFVRFEKALLDEELVNGLARSGCTLLQLGLESGSQRVLDRLAKGTRLDEVSRILANLARAGIAAYVYIMLGTPGETEEDAELTRRFLEEHAPAIGFLNLAIMNLPRDAPLLDDPERHGIRSSTLLGDCEPLGLYQSFEAAHGWQRAQARRFLQRRLLGSPAIRDITGRTPPLFTSNHAFLFSSPR